MSRTICKFFTEHRVLRCFPMTFYIAFYGVFEKHVLCFSCSVNPSRLKHQIVGSRYRCCCIWCTRNATLYPSMALGKAFGYPLSLSLSLFFPNPPHGIHGNHSDQHFSRKLLLEGSCSVMPGWSLTGFEPPAPRCGLDFSLRKLGQKIKMCVSRDVVISKLARNEQKK